MPLVEVPGMRPVRMGDAGAVLRQRDGGVLHIEPSRPLGAYARSLIDRLDHWAAEVPKRALFAERDGMGGWRTITYGDASSRARSVGQYLIEAGLSVERPLLILSGNSLAHATLALGAMVAGIPYAPVSPAYSLVSKDFGKLRHVAGLVTPGMVFAEDADKFGPALAALGDVSRLDLARALTTTAGTDVAQAHRAVTGDTIAKFLFTSGSTGMPKAVINTQRMLCCNQVQIASALAFLQDEPPVLVDWLPWNHTAGGNHNFGIVLHNGGTLYIDDGVPTEDGVLRTVSNLTEVAPTLYFNVPKGYEMLAAHMERNAALRERFFSRVKLLQYAGAGLPQHVWDTLERLARETVGETIMIVTGYGSTETAPFASTTTWRVGRPGEVGLPAPGVEMKLVPTGEKLELRLKGPNITPGYWRQPETTATSFDDEGFYRIGDALKPVDPDDIGKGLLFDGRIAEDFKLSTGTWVNMAAVRSAIVRGLAPYVREAVLTGLDRSHIGAMLFLDVDAARQTAPGLERASEAELARSPAIRAALQERLDSLAAASTGSSTLVARAVILGEPPTIDRGELTDKGSINQRAVMQNRAGLVEDLHAEPPPPHVLVARKDISS